jgi:hypothetical protein
MVVAQKNAITSTGSRANDGRLNAPRGLKFNLKRFSNPHIEIMGNARTFPTVLWWHALNYVSSGLITTQWSLANVRTSHLVHYSHWNLPWNLKWTELVAANYMEISVGNTTISHWKTSVIGPRISGFDRGSDFHYLSSQLSILNSRANCGCPPDRYNTCISFVFTSVGSRIGHYITIPNLTLYQE